jgi:hypothetical protein
MSKEIERINAIGTHRRKKPELPVDGCVQKAEELIKKNGVCLFLFDMRGSRDYPNEKRRELQVQFIDLRDELQTKFGEYFPRHNLSGWLLGETQGVQIIGDGASVGIDNSQIIPEMVNLINQRVLTSFRFNIAEDCYDEKNMKTVK